MKFEKITMWIVVTFTLFLVMACGVFYLNTKGTSPNMNTHTAGQPAVGAPKTAATTSVWRNEDFGFELQYADPIVTESLSPEHVFVGPYDKESKYKEPSIYNRLEGDFATSSYFSLDELKKDLEEQGFSTSINLNGAVPTLIAINADGWKTVFILQNEFEYSIAEGPQPEAYTAEEMVSNMTFFTKHSSEEITAIIKEQQARRVYKNEKWGFSLEYSGKNTLVIEHDTSLGIKLRIYNLMGYSGSNVELEAAFPPKQFTIDDWMAQLTEGTSGEKINGLTVHVLKDTDATYYYFVKGGLIWTLSDTNLKYSTSRIKELLMSIKFIPKK